MDSSLLQAIINITDKGDIDTLNQSVAIALADNFPVTEISIIMVIKDNIADKVKEILKLTITNSNQDSKNYSLDDNERIIIANGPITETIQTASVTKQVLEGLEYLYIPLRIGNKITGVLKIESYEDLSEWLYVINGVIRIYCNHMSLFNESERDKLTGLLNRKTFDYKLDKLLEKQRKQQEKYVTENQQTENRHAFTQSFAWLGMLDIDHFKRVNDTYGHLFGDEVILLISQKMKQCFRSSDLLFRFGGEEFVIILEPIPDEMAKRTFERFRKTIADHSFPQVGKISVSIGYARITKNDFSHVILERADKALYHAKEHGRNCVYNFEELLESGDAEEKRKSGTTIFFEDN